jgi:hypothetical protein
MVGSRMRSIDAQQSSLSGGKNPLGWNQIAVAGYSSDRLEIVRRVRLALTIKIEGV